MAGIPYDARIVAVSLPEQTDFHSAISLEYRQPPDEERNVDIG
jgi:hypothetical protein